MLNGNDFVMCINCSNEMQVSNHPPVDQAKLNINVSSINNFTNEDFHRLENSSFEIISLDPLNSGSLRVFSFTGTNISHIGRLFSNFNIFITCSKCKSTFKNAYELKQHLC